MIACNISEQKCLNKLFQEFVQSNVSHLQDMQAATH